MKDRKMYDEKWNEGDYNCDKCGEWGSFLDGTMWGIGEGNIESCVCNDCLDNSLIEIEKEKK